VENNAIDYRLQMIVPALWIGNK